MAKKEFKQYGRLEVNKLDWLLAIACCVIAGGALWISLGIAIANAGASTGQAFLDVALAFGFVASVDAYGQSAVVIAYNSIIIYGSLALLVLGSMYLWKKDLKGRIPGLVAEFVSALGIAFLFAFFHEFLSGSAKGTVKGFWPIILILFLGALIYIAIYSVYAAFNTNVNIELGKEEAEEEKPAEEETPAEEAPVEEEKEPEAAPVEEEAPAEEEKVEEVPAEEEVPEEEEAEEEEAEDEDEGEEEEEGEEEPVEGEEGEFSGFGKRHKRVPFENKIRRAKPETREKYKEIVAGLRQYDFNDRRSIPGETFSYKKEKMIFITLSGSTLKVFFKLDPAQFVDSPIPVKDMSEVKKYSATPACLKIKSGLAVKRTLALAEQVANENNVPKK